MTMQIERKYADEAARGADLIEKVNPGALSRVDLDTLNMKHGELCVVGQSLGRDGWSYYDKLDTLGVGRDLSTQVEYGFITANPYTSSMPEWDALQAAWIDEIKNRT